MDVITRVILVDENREKFFGEGPWQLLAGVESLGSLHAAAQSMGMAYSKAMKILKRAEAVLGYPLTTRSAGGFSGGGSKLTEKGKEWLHNYEAYRNACVEANRRLYLEFFPQQRQAASDSDGEPEQR